MCRHDNNCSQTDQTLKGINWDKLTQQKYHSWFFYSAFRVILSLSALIDYNTITLSFRDENCPKFHFQFLSLSSVFNMTLPMHDNCCLPSRKTWTYSCGLCPSVFNTWDEKVCHNLHHFVPCTNVSQDTTQQRSPGRTFEKRQAKNKHNLMDAVTNVRGAEKKH